MARLDRIIGATALIGLLSACSVPVCCAKPEEPSKRPVLSSTEACEAEAQAYKAKAGEPLGGIPSYPFHRVIWPGTFVTLDYHPDRLNIRLDEDDLIQDAYCG